MTRSASFSQPHDQVHVTFIAENRAEVLTKVYNRQPAEDYWFPIQALVDARHWVHEGKLPCDA